MHMVMPSWGGITLPIPGSLIYSLIVFMSLWCTGDSLLICEQMHES